jgi:hypothetical protein
MLEAQRELLLERAQHAARARRQKMDPRQRELLEAIAPPAPEASAAAEPAADVQTSAAPDPAAGLGADEHKVAEQLDVPGDAAPPAAAKPKITMRPPKTWGR